MKKFSLILIAAVLTASAALAEEVYSQNAVGFINKTIEGGKFACLSFPFVDMTATNNLVEFDKTDLALNSKPGAIVYFWNDTSWKSVPRRANGFNTRTFLKPGEMFMYKPAETETITICGEVPDASTIECDVVGGGNLTAGANPYPVSFEFDKSGIASNSTAGAIFYYWDEVNAGWKSIPRRANGFNTKYTVKPGEGFMLKSGSAAASTVWTVERPYDFPAEK